MRSDLLYRGSRYRLWLGGRPVAGFEHMKTPGRNKYESITLERGITRDLAFRNWAAGGARRRDLAIERLNRAGVPVVRYKFSESWIAPNSILPNLNANANAIAIEHIHIENEGWARDVGSPPSEPVLTTASSREPLLDPFYVEIRNLRLFR
jgi:phage tail-like protein